MTRSTFAKVLLASIASLVLVFVPNPAFAQRGGGGHGGGGGFHGGGGGGFHGGGGFSGGGHSGFSGGGRSYGGGAYRSGGGFSSRAYGGSAYRGSGFGGRSVAGLNGRSFGSAGRSSGVRNAIADGQWHSFGSAGRVTNAAASSGFRNSASADGRWHSFGGTHNTLAANTHAVSPGRAISSFGGSRVGGSAFTNSALGRNTFFGGNRFGGTAFGSGFGNRGFGGFGGLGRGWRGGYGWGGCWNCGWGWGGFGWGWGWPGPYWGFGWGYPSLAWGWDNYDFGYYTDYAAGDYNGNSVYSGSPYSPSDFNYDSTPLRENKQSSQGSTNTNPTTGNVAESTATVLLYLKDGTMYAATDYWFSGSKLHYVVSYGGESTVDMDQLDLQRTVDENAKRGIRFSLRPKPDASNSTPTAATPSPAP